MADINFNGGKASNMADAKFEQDGINLRTLRRYSSILTANTISTVVSGITSGANISISGTSSAITISVNPNIVTTSINAGTILSAGTDLYSIFLTTADGNDITRVQPGLNTYTGGTINNPTVNISAATLSFLSATTISADTYYGDGSNLSGISTDNFYTTAVTLNNNIAYFNRNDLLSAYTLDLSIFSAATFTGTTNYYSKFNSGGTIQNGFIYDDGLSGIVLKGNDNTSLAIVSPTGFYYPSLNFYNNGGTSLGGISAYAGALYISGAGAPTTPLLVGSVVSMPYLSGNSLTFLNSYSQFQNLVLGSGLMLTTGGTLSVSGVSGDNFYTTGATLSGNTIVFSRNDLADAYSVNLSGITSTGNFLSISGGTVTGDTIFTSGLTANFIDFNTGATITNKTSRLYFDSTEKALSYFPNENQNVIIRIGQQLYSQVYNNTASIIPKGSAVKIESATSGIPNVTLAIASGHTTNNQVIGLVADDIQSGNTGFVLNKGLLSGITINTFNVGDILYLSDTIAGGYVNSTASLEFNSRSNQIGYVIATGTSISQIYVDINNEDINLTLTNIERNILEGNIISTGTYEFSGITTASTTTINIAPMRGWIVKNTYNYSTLPDIIHLNYTGETGVSLTNLNSADATYLLINSASTLVQQLTFPTPQERRENVFIGKIIHVNRTTITSINQTTDYDASPMSALRDLWKPLKLINEGILISANGANLNINISSGTLWGNGIGWNTNQLSPNNVSITGNSPATFQYRTQTGGSFSNTTSIIPSNYDLNGVVTAIGGGSNSSTNQRIYLYPTGNIRIQYGQTVYSSLAAAVTASQTEAFVEFSNNRDNAILIGILSVQKTATNLNDTSQAIFNNVSKFGEILGGTGGISTTTLQQAYDNSSTPEIVINSSLDGLSLKNGTGNADNITNLLEGQNSGGTTTSFIRANGDFSGNSITANTIFTSTATTSILSATTVSVTTTSNLYGSINTSFTGTTSRIVEAASGGTLSATKDFIDIFLIPGSTPAVLLSSTSGWTGVGVYTGTSITATYQGQQYYDSNYYFVAVNDNDWIRMARV